MFIELKRDFDVRNFVIAKKVRKLSNFEFYVACSFSKDITNKYYISGNIQINTNYRVERDNSLYRFKHGVRIVNQHNDLLAIFIREKNTVIVNKQFLFIIKAQNDVYEGLELFKEDVLPYIIDMYTYDINPTLGGDPEYEQLKYPYRYTPQRATVRGGQKAKIGVDGSGCQIELRPGVAKTPEEYVLMIDALMKKCPNMSVIGDRYSLGGHIHIGLPYFLRDEDNYYKLSLVLDYFLGKMIVDTSGEARGGYKELTEYEGKPYGFEYRSLPSSFYISKELTNIVYRVAKAITEYTIENGISIDRDKECADISDYLNVGLSEYDYYAIKEFQDWYEIFKYDYPNVKVVWENNEDPYKEYLIEYLERYVYTNEDIYKNV